MGRRRDDWLPQDTRKYLTSAIKGRSVTINEAVALFLESRLERNCRPATIRTCRIGLSKVARTLNDIEAPQEVRHVTDKHIRSLILEWQRQGLKPRTIASHLKHTRILFDWLYKRNYMDDKITADIVYRVDTVETIQPFTDAQLRTLFKACDLNTFTGTLDYTIMATLLDTGVRIGELLSADITDFNLTEGSLLIRKPKGQKQRYVPLSEGLVVSLKRWLHVRGTGAMTSAMFISLEESRISKESVQRHMRKLRDDAGVTGVRCSPHTFRHTFAKKALQNKANMFELQQILGHSTLEMTRRYVLLFDDDVSLNHKKFSPLNNLKL